MRLECKSKGGSVPDDQRSRPTPKKNWRRDVNRVDRGFVFRPSGVSPVVREKMR